MFYGTGKGGGQVPFINDTCPLGGLLEGTS